MKSFWIDGARWGLLLLASSAGCALVGYNIGDYKPADTSSTAAGAGGTTTAGTQSSAASQPTGATQSAGVGGKSGSSGAGGLGGSAGDGGSGGGGGSTGTGIDDPCMLPTDCNDGNPCTHDVCDDKGQCAHDKEAACCPHSVCDPGVPLDGPNCTFDDPTTVGECVPAICDSSKCCSSEWTSTCVKAAQFECTKNIPMAPISFTCTCIHSYCVSGVALDPFCDPCVHAVCEHTASCCSLATGYWDDSCVAATATYCHVPSGAACQ